MGLGLFIGGLLVGAALIGSSDSASSVTYVNNTHSSRSSYEDTQREKVEFFDAYRSLDNYLGRLVGQGSGGIGLLILTCRYLNVDNGDLNYYISSLARIRDYRNNLAHNKSQWRNLPDPDYRYVGIINEVYNIVYRDENYIAKMMYKEMTYKQKQRRY